MTDSGFDRRVAAVRRFNRFYTQKIGVLSEGLVESPFSLAEARVLYELAHRDRPTAAALAADLGLDPGYLSRILRGFGARGLLAKERSRADGRQILLSLTPKGRRAFAPLDRRSREQVGALLERLPVGGQRRLVDSMSAVEALLGARPEGTEPYLLRAHEPGDFGWIIERHAVLYAREYGWNGQFEAMVAEIAAGIIRNFDPKRERCWIAERAGERVGAVCLVGQSKTVAKLRLLLVEPEARGLGIGARLVEECLRFARQTGYRKITLWTNSILDAARRIYRQAGFRLARRERHHSFGKDLVGEYWELEL